MQVCLIWAQDRRGAIGKAGTLAWHVPEDLAYFKDVTQGCPVIMGRKTWDSLPRGALPGRQNVVVTRDAGKVFAQAQSAPSLPEALALARPGADGRVFVIGGAELYRQALPLAHRVYVTELDLLVEAADTFAPPVPGEFELRQASPWQHSRTGVAYRFMAYERAEG